MQNCLQLADSNPYLKGSHVPGRMLLRLARLELPPTSSLALLLATSPPSSPAWSLLLPSTSVSPWPTCTALPVLPSACSPPLPLVSFSLHICLSMLSSIISFGHNEGYRGCLGLFTMHAAVLGCVDFNAVATVLVLQQILYVLLQSCPLLHLGQWISSVKSNTVVVLLNATYQTCGA